MIHNTKDFSSRFVIPRNIDVWLPDDLSDGERLPVLYMHDGQNLFDPSIAYGGVDWGVHHALMNLRSSKKVRGAIIVGVWNTSKRWQEYMPSVPLNGKGARTILTQFLLKAGGKPISDAYLNFLVEELKPFIDDHFPTLSQQEHTYIMGSSMGGLISMYALCKYPHVFHGAGCLSTHWPAGGMPLVEGLGAILPAPGRNKLYFDYGTTTLDKDYEPFQKRMDELLQGKGYQRPKDWLTCKFEGAEHNEAAWRTRVHIPLEFLIRSPESPSFSSNCDHGL